jgi:hypothetical protein
LILCALSNAASAAVNPRTALFESVEQLLKGGELDKIEAMAAEFRATDARFVGSNSKLFYLYGALGAFKNPPDRCSCGNVNSAFTFEEKERTLKAWLTQKPASLAARLGLYELFANYAWVARGHAYAKQVNEAQWRLFYERLQIAGGYLKELDPKDDPSIYEAYLELAGNTGPRAELDRVYAGATRAFPQFFHFYADRADKLQEKWYGEPGELATFTRSLLRSPGGEDGQIAYTYVAGRLARQYEPKYLFQATGLLWPLLKEAYLTREKRYGLGTSELRTLLICAVAANDQEYAAAVREKLRTIGEEP